MKIILAGEKNETIDIGEDESLFDLLKRIHKDDYTKYLGIKVNNKLQGLQGAKFKENDVIEFIDISDKDGNRIYVRTLTLIYIKACKDIFDQIDVCIVNSLSKGLYTELRNKHMLDNQQLEKIKVRMQEIIDQKRPINSKLMKVERAMEIFKKQNLEDKIELLTQWDKKDIRICELDGYYDTFYGYLAPNTEFVKGRNFPKFLRKLKIGGR
ncbi:MAG: uridine kinase [Sedimentibacter sp.]|nr:uridine kinase [Sedimentibacter sp.]